MNIAEQSVPARPTNKDDDMGELYSSQWMQFHLSAALSQNIPKQYKDVLRLTSLSEQRSWREAMDEEYKSLMN